LKIDENPVWNKGEGFKIIVNKGSFDSKNDCSVSEEYDPINLAYLLDKYDKHEYSHALIYKEKVVHAYGHYWNFQICMEWA